MGVILPFLLPRPGGGGGVDNQCLTYIGGELAVVITMRTMRMVLAVATVTMTMTADDAVGGMATTR